MSAKYRMQILAVALSLGYGLGGGAWAAECDDLLSTGPSSGPSRPVSTDDLVRLRDIGGMGADPAPFLAVSPDGTEVAFQIRRADPVSNSYCLGMAVVPLDGRGAVRLVDQGGEFILQQVSRLGFARSTPPGTPLVTAPKWSADGQWVAYLRRDKGVTQVWRARRNGAGAEPVTRSTNDIIDFAWGALDKGIVYTASSALAVAEKTIDEEASQGFLFDDRYMPIASLRPYVRGQILIDGFFQSFGSEAVRRASEDEIRSLNTVKLSTVPKAAQHPASRGNAVAWTTRLNLADIASATLIEGQDGSGRPFKCAVAICQGVIALWWMEDGVSLVYLKREGAREGRTALYKWKPSNGLPRRVISTTDIFLSCQLVSRRLVCGHEGSDQPRRLVSIEVESGGITPVFDPNPEFQALKLGRVERLEWTSALGVSTFGDLVLPPSYHPGEKLPLVVVSYQSRGFLRGGTGDEYPIHALAGHGFAVLSFQNPPGVETQKGIQSWTDANRLNFQNWTFRRNVQASIEAGLDLLIDREIVDPKRIGITGLSDGASTVVFALLNSDRFAAAATSTCCHEPSSSEFLSGSVVSQEMERLGYPTMFESENRFWDAVSFRRSGSRVHTPLLMQLADREALLALEGFTALKESGRAVELYVFPDEYHVKWQPAHRQAIYDRSVDWFRFWLNNEVDPVSTKSAQYERWRVLRDQVKRN